MYLCVRGIDMYQARKLNTWPINFLAWYMSIPLTHKYMTDQFPGLIHVDTPNTQIHDRSIFWLGTCRYPKHTNTWPINFLAWYMSIPLTHKYMTDQFPGLVLALTKVAKLNSFNGPNTPYSSQYVYWGGSRISSLGGRTWKKCAERREARKLLGYFVWKITILRQEIIFFPF
jgi:hypothetical protein